MHVTTSSVQAVSIHHFQTVLPGSFSRVALHYCLLSFQLLFSKRVMDISKQISTTIEDTYTVGSFLFKDMAMLNTHEPEKLMHVASQHPHNTFAETFAPTNG